MGDYHDHYLKKDVLLLANVFEKFIGTCLKFDKLDPYNYFSSPRLSWDTMLKTTGVGIEKISDIGMYLFIEKEFLSFVKDIVTQITNTWNVMILQNHQNSYRTLV